MGFLLGPKNTWLILLLGMSLFATSAAVAKPQASLRRGELAPELEWLGADGANYRWQDLQQGHPAVVVFWGTWCAVCKKDWPELKVLAEEFATTEMAPVWIAVAVLDTPAKTAAVANQRQLPGVQLCDPEEKNFASLGLEFVPTICVLDAAGKVIFVGEAKPKKLRRVLTSLYR